MRINTFALAATMVVASLTLAAKTPTFLKKNDNMSILLHLNSWKSETITVAIKDQFGSTVFSETIQKPSGNRKYDLSGLGKGEYGFVVEDGLKLAAQTIVVKEDGILVNPATEERFKPVVKSRENVWQIQGLTLGSKAQISIINNDGDNVFQETIAKPVVERSYDVTRLERGDYTLICKIGNDTFMYPVEKK